MMMQLLCWVGLTFLGPFLPHVYENTLNFQSILLKKYSNNARSESLMKLSYCKQQTKVVQSEKPEQKQGNSKLEHVLDEKYWKKTAESLDFNHQWEIRIEMNENMSDFADFFNIFSDSKWEQEPFLILNIFWQVSFESPLTKDEMTFRFPSLYIC